MCRLCTLHCTSGYWPYPHTYNRSLFVASWETLQATGQYGPHELTDLLVYNELVAILLTHKRHTSAGQTLGPNVKSATRVMARTGLNKRTQAAQLIINSVFIMAAAAETGVVKNKSKETLSGPQILVGSSARLQMAHPNN